jgi:hypothetical protein
MKQHRQKIWAQILKWTFIVGTLDILAAFINGYLRSDIMPAVILKFIASGVFGKAAFEGGYEMMAMGLVFHFLIAFACTAVFYFVYPHFKFLQWSHLLNGFLVGLIAWLITTRIIIQLSHTPPAQEFNLVNALIAIGILTVCIGFPLSVSAKRYYSGV